MSKNGWNHLIQVNFIISKMPIRNTFQSKTSKIGNSYLKLRFSITVKRKIVEMFLGGIWRNILRRIYKYIRSTDKNGKSATRWRKSQSCTYYNWWATFDQRNRLEENSARNRTGFNLMPIEWYSDQSKTGISKTKKRIKKSWLGDIFIWNKSCKSTRGTQDGFKNCHRHVFLVTWDQHQSVI